MDPHKSLSIRIISPHRTRNIWRITLHKYLLDFRKEYAYDFSLTQSPTVSSWTSTVISTKEQLQPYQDLIAFSGSERRSGIRLGAGFGKSLGETLSGKTLPCRKLSNTERMTVLSSPARTMPSPVPLSLRDRQITAIPRRLWTTPQSNGINESNLKIVGLFQMDKDTITTALIPVPVAQHRPAAAATLAASGL